jgi:GTP-binding protein
MQSTGQNTGLFSRNCEFMIGATAKEHLPHNDIPAVAFVGRSNVGKSSFLNSLVRRRNLARTSQAPGRTRQINFFLLDNKLYLVDLPGYGYAKASKQDIMGWNNLMLDYLHNSTKLQRIFLLIDSRHGLKKSDLEMLHFLASCAVSTQIILTKVDKINRSERETVLMATKNASLQSPICHPEIICCSSQTKEGIQEAQISILDCCRI